MKTGIPIILSTTHEHFEALRMIIQTTIINLEAWEKGDDQYLKYKIGDHVTERLSISIAPEIP